MMKQQFWATAVAVAASATVCLPAVELVVLLLQLAKLRPLFIQLLLQLLKHGFMHDTPASGRDRPG
jgi:hypothetical protein